jgi:DNA-binding CsgD family transcriptional regulator
MADVATRARQAGSESAGVTAYRQAADLAVRMMDYRGADRLLGEGLRYADSIEQSNCAHIMAATSAIVAWADGQWDAAVTGGEQAVSDRGCRRAATMAQWPLGFVALGRGEVDRAEAILGAAADIGNESGSPDLILPPAWGRAEAALQAGDARRAIEACESAQVVASDTGERSLFAPFVVTGVRAYHLAGEPDRAEQWLRRCTDLLADSPSLSWPAIDHGRGLVALAAGSTGIARGALEAAVRGWDERGRAWESAWARLDLANCLMRSNRVAEAAAIIADVTASATQLGSPPLAARAEELSRLARGRGSVDESWRPLTAREFEVARLIRDGLTNIEIGRALTIAPKTASAHVEHILAKLGVNRRAEIAAWVASVTRSPSGSQPQRTAVGATH